MVNSKICKKSIDLKKMLILFRVGILGTAHGLGGGESVKKSILPKICDIYPTIMKLGTDVTYLKKIQKLYKSRDTFLELL